MTNRYYMLSFHDFRQLKNTPSSTFLFSLYWAARCSLSIRQLLLIRLSRTPTPHSETSWLKALGGSKTELVARSIANSFQFMITFLLSLQFQMDVYTYLFSDLLILTKAVNKKTGPANSMKLRPIHAPMSLSQIVVKPVVSQQEQISNSTSRNGLLNQGININTFVPLNGNFTLVYLNECNVAISAFLVNVGSPNNANTWLCGINNAKVPTLKSSLHP